MKKWILPTLAVGGLVFLMTPRGRELQEQISDNFGDWVDGAIRSNHRLQQTLTQVQGVLERFNRTLQQVA